MNTKVYKKKNIPLEHSMIIPKPDEPSQSCSSLPNMLNIIKKSISFYSGNMKKITNIF